VKSPWGLARRNNLRGSDGRGTAIGVGPYLQNKILVLIGGITAKIRNERRLEQFKSSGGDRTAPGGEGTTESNGTMRKKEGGSSKKGT